MQYNSAFLAFIYFTAISFFKLHYLYINSAYYNRIYVRLETRVPCLTNIRLTEFCGECINIVMFQLFMGNKNHAY